MYAFCVKADGYRSILIMINVDCAKSHMSDAVREVKIFEYYSQFEDRTEACRKGVWALAHALEKFS